MIVVDQDLPEMNRHVLAKVRSRFFQAKLLVLILVTAALITLVLTLPGILWIIPSLLLGLAYAHGVELQHQCLHNTAYRSRLWNRIVGIACGLPSFVSFSDYQNSHLKHHRLLGTPEDKEFFNYSYEKLTSLTALIPHLWMVRHYGDVVGFIAKSVMGKLVRENEANLKIAKRIRFEYQLMALFLLTMVAVTIAFQTPLFLMIWFIPFLIAVPVHALIELPEHIGCNVRTRNVLENTRTIKASKIANWFVDGNNYHVEHHWQPGIPNDRFPELHKYVVANIDYLETSYWSFYKQFYRNLRKNNLHRPWKPELLREMNSQAPPAMPTAQ